MKNKLIANFFFSSLKTGGCCVLLNLVSMADSGAQTQTFEIISRNPLISETGEKLGISKNNTFFYCEYKEEQNKSQYKIRANQKTFNIDAFSNIEYAQKGDRIVTYGDSMKNDLPVNFYARFYTGNGSLIKSLGLVARWPYIASLAENGSFMVAGNKNKPGEIPYLFLASFDRNGSRQWEKAITKHIPAGIFKAYNNKYVALVLYNPETISGSIQFYNSSGSLLYTDVSHTPVRAIEFLSNDKVVICSGSVWYLLDAGHGFKQIATGSLKGNSIGKYPVSGHPSGNVFFVVTENDYSSRTGYHIQAISAVDGKLIAEYAFDGIPDQPLYRLLEASDDGTIKVVTSSEIVSFKIK